MSSPSLNTLQALHTFMASRSYGPPEASVQANPAVGVDIRQGGVPVMEANARGRKTASPWPAWPNALNHQWRC